MSMHKDIPINFYIFDQMLNSFYHVFERSDWKISVVPYQQLKEQVNATILTCNSVIANSSQTPSTNEINAMTEVLQWGREKANKDYYQLELYFDPQYRDSPFIDCFDNKISAWFDAFIKDEQHQALMYLLGIAIFLGAVALICGGGFLAYEKCKEKSANRDWETSLFREPQPSNENKVLLDMPHIHQYGTTNYNTGTAVYH